MSRRAVRHDITCRHLNYSYGPYKEMIITRVVRRLISSQMKCSILNDGVSGETNVIRDVWSQEIKRE